MPVEHGIGDVLPQDFARSDAITGDADRTLSLAADETDAAMDPTRRIAPFAVSL